MDTEERPDVSADELEKQFQQPAHTDSAHTEPDRESRRGFGTISRNNVANKIAGRTAPPASTKPSAGRIAGASYPVGPLGGGDKGGGLTGGAAGSVKDKALGAAAGAAAEAAGIPAPIAKSFLGKNKGKIILGTLGIIVVIIALIIAFFLSLFKLKDLEKLFLSYEFALANHTISVRTQEILAENKANDIAKGNADTAPADSNAPLEEQLSKANSDQLSQAESDPAAQTQEIARTQALDLTAEGTFGEFAPAYGVSETGEPPAEGDNPTQDEVNKGVAKEVATETGTAEAGASVPVDPALENQARTAETESNGGTPTDVALTDAGNTSPSGVMSLGPLLTGGLFASVLYCIAYNIFHTAAVKIANLTTNGLMQYSTTMNVAAEKQTVNQLTAYQVGGYSNLIDSTDGTGTSGIQAAAYSRANHQTPDPKTDLAAESRPFGAGGSNTAIGLFINEAANVPVIGPASNVVCPILVDPKVQAVLLGANIIAIASSVLDAGASGAGEAAVSQGTKLAVEKALVKALTSFALKTGATIAGADALKELVKFEVARQTGLGVSNTTDRVQNVGKWDAGDSLMATESIKNNGGHVLTDQQASSQSTITFAEQAKQLSRHSMAYRVFSPNNPYSLVAKVLVRLPSSPQAMVARTANFFASLFNPAHLFATLGELVPSGIANADTALPCPGAAYGIPCYGFTDAQVSQWSFRDNSQWVEARGLDSFKKYDKCFNTKLANTFDTSDGSKPSKDFASDGMCNNENDPALAHYQVYMLDRRIVQNLVDYGNNTSKTGGGSVPAPTTNAVAGPIYFLGDSILERLASGGLAASLSTKGFQPATIDFSIGRSITTNGGAVADGNKLSGLAAIDADAAAIQSAKTIVVELGTNIGDSSDRNTFKSEVGTVIDKLRALNGSAPIQWVDMVSTSNPSYPDRNAALAEELATKGPGVGVIDARAGNIQLDPDGIHPSIPAGVSALRDLIVNALHP